MRRFKGQSSREAMPGSSWERVRRIAGLVGALLLTASLAGCVSYSSGPTVVLPPGATVICPNGSPATYGNGAYHC
ncbi:MAG TPA: hypothetical protein VKY65_22130 [Alphaproteobacteria bacterium]|nr:hypothetical protein [Alphaproteobacteria bacterium]